MAIMSYTKEQKFGVNYVIGSVIICEGH